MQQELEFFENAEDALRAACGHLGGFKVVGKLLWPAKHEEAGKHLANCINSEHAAKLEVEQLIFILRTAKEAGHHAPFAWLAGEIGYEVKPLVAAEQIDRVASVIEQASKTMAQGLATLERLQRVRVAA